MQDYPFNEDFHDPNTFLPKSSPMSEKEIAELYESYPDRMAKRYQWADEERQHFFSLIQPLDPKDPEIYSEIDYTDEGRYRTYDPNDYRDRICKAVLKFLHWVFGFSL